MKERSTSTDESGRELQKALSPTTLPPVRTQYNMVRSERTHEISIMSAVASTYYMKKYEKYLRKSS